MQNFRKMGALLGAGAVIFTLAGCADRNGNGQPDSVATGGEVGNAAAGATNAVADAGSAVANGAVDAGKAVANAGKGAADAVTGAGAAATLTPKIKTAIGASAALKGSNINVNTDASKKTVMLVGTVKSAAQKTLAQKIAQQNSADFKVDATQLKVGK